MKAAVKTFIDEWSVSEGKEKITFPKLDFSPDQVGNLDRILRDTENKVTMTISVVKKKLQFEPIVYQVHIVSINCMNGGQKLKISGFKSPDSRAVAMKSLADTKEPVTITIEDKQQRLFDDSDKDKSKEGEQKEFEPAPEPNENGVFESPNEIEVKLPKSYRTKLVLFWVRYKGKFYTGFDLTHSRIGTKRPVRLSDAAFNSLYDCLIVFMSQDSLISKVIDEATNYKYKKQLKAAIRKAVKSYLEGDYFASDNEL